MLKNAFVSGMKHTGLIGLVGVAGLLTACTEYSDLASPLKLKPPAQLTADEVPVTDWAKAETVTLLATEFLFTPNDPVFRVGQPYQLVIRNIGDLQHIVRGPHFLRSIAVKEVSLTAFMGHSDDGHGDKPIGPDNDDAIPKLPPPKEGARDLVAENEAEVKKGGAEGAGSDEANPFAADAEEDEDDDATEAGIGETGSEDGDSEAANPFAAKDEESEEESGEDSGDEETAGNETDGDGEEPANPFASKDEDEEEDGSESAEQDSGDADEETASSDDDADNADESKPSPVAEIEDDDGDSEDDEEVSAKKAEPSEEVDDDDDVIVKASDGSKSDKKIAAKPATGKLGVKWQPVSLERITIPKDHEVTIEFVAVRPGKFRFFSGDARFALTGMFGTATIEDPPAEE